MGLEMTKVPRDLLTFGLNWDHWLSANKELIIPNFSKMLLIIHLDLSMMDRCSVQSSAIGFRNDQTPKGLIDPSGLNWKLWLSVLTRN